MMNWTDRHCRSFMRLISENAILYTEMITTGALLYGDADYHLKIDADESPVALQLGGSDPRELEKCSNLVEKHSYSEINLNCGCPSDRVQNALFGAVMMKNAKLTAECVSSLLSSSHLPITVKHRIGVDDFDSYEFLYDVIGPVSYVWWKKFIIHARKAWLKGLSPKQNREVPELNYEIVSQMKNEFPQLEIIVNGGVTDFQEYIDGTNPQDDPNDDRNPVDTDGDGDPDSRDPDSDNDGCSDVERSGRGGWGRVADVNHPLAFLNEKVVHHVTSGSNGLSPDAGRRGFQVFPLDFRDQPLEGSNERSFVVWSPHLAQAHFPMFHRHFSKSRFEFSLAGVAINSKQLVIVLLSHA